MATTSGGTRNDAAQQVSFPWENPEYLLTISRSSAYLGERQRSARREV
jgi:hypothetical protein